MAKISLQDVRLAYPVYNVQGRSLKVSMLSQLAGARIDATQGGVLVHALDGVSLDIREGDRIGLVGRNGSGKSTLLRVMAGVAYPQSGSVSIEGRVTPLIERGLGVNPEMSGRQNIELPIRLLGGNDAEVRAALEEIPEWTGLGSFIDLPVRTYSAGMYARFLFALCTAVHGDILVFDEWLGAADKEFIERAHARIGQMLDKSSIVVLASHSLDIIMNFCNRLIWMEQGRVIMAGDPLYVHHYYVTGERPPGDAAVPGATAPMEGPEPPRAEMRQAG